MKKRLLTSALICLAASTMLAACGGKTSETSSAKGGEEAVLEFYHGYYQSEKEWPAAQVMRDLYDKFAKDHANGKVEFKAVPVDGSITDVMKNKVASGEFPDMIDLAGNDVSLAAIEQGLVLDLKPYIDKNGLEKNVGLNYTQNDVNGKIYTVHDQLLTLGLWYNTDIFAKAGAKTPDKWEKWSDFTDAMALVRKQGVYAFGAGEPAIRLFNTVLGSSEAGRKLLDGPLTKEGIESKEFAEALKVVMTEVQANGSANAGGDANTYSTDFTANKSAVFFNGVWAAGGLKDNKSLKPGLYAGNIAISAAGGGLTVSSKLSKEEEELALEFVKYMTSDDVQKTIFEKVGSNPASQTIDTAKIASGSSDATVKLLGEATSQANNAKVTVPTVLSVWGGDVRTAIINALTESAADGVNIDQKVKETQDILKALIG
ncbi:bacterial extracellular solute-binding protein [Streptococcus varani]|uniref:Bacterial extracellular solute-binding protein n=1 Tax=Streptococcus varani TaxID=1608583 RepID=A0A0E4H514_9STRE|nr:extracellular solute-binding protein [Streptococcus varani]CQR24967.1 bacterial extracellular solute-binding protein [Streptococcus varani]